MNGIGYRLVLSIELAVTGRDVLGEPSGLGTNLYWRWLISAFDATVAASVLSALAYIAAVWWARRRGKARPVATLPFFHGDATGVGVFGGGHDLPAPPRRRRECAPAPAPSRPLTLAFGAGLQQGRTRTAQPISSWV